MATEAGGSRPLTALVAGNGQSSVSYPLPAGLVQYVQSVVATINTTSSGDVTPLLTVTDDAGIVVADKQQGQALDAGGSGRATWALRLTDEGGASTATGFIRYSFPNVGAWLSIATTPGGHGGPLNRSFGVYLPGSGARVGDFELQSTDNGAVNTASFYFSVTNGATFSVPIADFTVDAGPNISLQTGNGVGPRLHLVDVGKMIVTLAASSSFQVNDSTGTALFRVDADGSLHGLTGQALTFDL